MPFTPFHFGPGYFFKVLCRRNFSFVLFMFTQILMDLEPLVRLIIGTEVIHGFSHTLLGALFVTILCLVTGQLAYRLMRFLILFFFRSEVGDLPLRIGFKTILVTSIIGTYSHVLLDALMHHDVYLFYPNRLIQINGIVELIPLHLACIGIAYLSFWLNKKLKKQPSA